jgi:hypothetical protein
MRDPDQALVEEMAHAFARALVAGEFEAARALLSDTLKEQWTSARLAEQTTDLLFYCEMSPEHVVAVRFDEMEGWANRQVSDLGWACVAIYGDGFNEAVSLIISREAGRAAIRDIEWGRP